MKTDAKNRLIYALAGGALVPISYFLFLIVLKKFYPIALSRFGKWFIMPIAWPAYLYDYLFPAPVDSSLFYDFPVTGFWVYLIVANFILYSLLVYVGLGWKQTMPRLK